MRLSKLEIKGFKSFPDRTVLEFKPGITSVVGPNGCGKSNIFEAIRWVMGEQRARLLRGTKMGDVIFNGSESRKPIGMAEVSMTLSLTSGTGASNLTAYDEIMIARRLFRDGESQYEINKVPCRMSDVIDLFLDTGLVRNSYAIIEQGRVEMVVASKPDERRWLIEEAAGISRYKFRKETTVKRLEQAQANLDRIRDLVLEVKRQASGLRKQASKAERYRSLHKKLRDLELLSHALKCQELSDLRETCRIDLGRSRDALLASQALNSSVGAQLQKERQALAEQEEASKSLVQQKHLCEIEMESARAGIKRSEERRIQLQLHREMLIRDQKDQEQLGVQRREKHAEADAMAQSLRAGMLEAQHRLTVIAQDLEELRTQRSSMQQELESVRVSLFEHLQDRANKKNMKESNIRRVTEIDARTKRIDKEREDLAITLQDSRVRVKAITEELEDAARQLKDMEDDYAGLSLQIETSRLCTTQLREDLRSLETEHAAVVSRMRSLQEIAKSFAHYGQGVQQVMRNRPNRMDGSLDGPLAELIDVPAEYEKALAAALERRLGSLVVSSPKEGVIGLELLRDTGQGRTTFVPKKPRFVKVIDDIGEVQGARRLLDVVRFQEGYEDLAQHLLGRCLLVQDLTHALDLWSRNGTPWDLVTLEGEFLSRHGELSGGSWEVGPERVFEQRRIRAELSQRVASLEEAVSEKKNELHAQELSCDAALLRQRDLTGLIADLRLAGVTRHSEIEKINARIESLDRKHGALELEKKALDHEKGSLITDTKSLEQQIQELEDTVAGLQKVSQASKAALADMDNQYDTQAKHHVDTQVELAQYRERFHAVENELKISKDATIQIETRLAAIQTDLEANGKETDRIEKDVRNDHDKEKRLMLHHKDLTEKLHTTTQMSDALTQRIRSMEDQLMKAQSEEKAFREDVHRQEMEEIQLQQSIDVLVQRMLERYSVDPRTIVPRGENPLPAEIEHARKEIESLGEVNLAAVEEFQKIQERLDFLKGQERDLNQAAASLRATIQKINGTTNDLFITAFTSINEKFQEIFTFLFGGGEASLELVGSENVLEAGVDITARPPGKKRQAMALLSGGEKALTAIALIFAIFLTRPSPFCLLDEVDAPLDDANVSRFNDMLQSLASSTQFIVITHNKRTMEIADSLYGITMEEPGVSTVVSVDFPA
jgi:chromosome segregation protein